MTTFGGFGRAGDVFDTYDPFFNDPFFDRGFGTLGTTTGYGGLGTTTGYGGLGTTAGYGGLGTTTGYGGLGTTTGYGYDRGVGGPVLGYTSRRRYRPGVGRLGDTTGVGGVGVGRRGVGYDLDFDYLPDIDAFDTDNKFVVAVEVPGVPREAINMDVRDGDLIIRGERKENDEINKSDNIRLRERDIGRFRRRVRLPAGVDTTNIQANYDHGVLEISIPKAGGGETRRIEIGA